MAAVLLPSPTTVPATTAVPVPRTRSLPAGPAHAYRPTTRCTTPRAGRSPVVAAAGAGARRRLLGLVAVVIVLLAVATLAQLPAADAAPASSATYVVAEGDSMWSIAQDHARAGGAAGYVERLVESNGTSVVRAGQVIVLPRP